MEAACRSAATTLDHAEGEYSDCLSVLIQSSDDALIALLPVAFALQFYDLPEMDFDDGTKSTRLARISKLLETDPWNDRTRVNQLREIFHLAADLSYVDIRDIGMQDYWTARYVLEAIADAARRQADTLERDILVST